MAFTFLITCVVTATDATQLGSFCSIRQGTEAIAVP